MAARFWVTGGTTTNWSDTSNWSATSGGARGASAPGSADTATFNATSGSGTATINSNITIQTLNLTGFTGILAFGTNSISLNSTGSVYTGTSSPRFTGTPVINVTSTGSTAITITGDGAGDSISFNITGGTYSLSLSQTFRDLNFTGFSGTLAAPAFSIAGSLTLSSTMTVTSSVQAVTFISTAGDKTITSNGKPFPRPLDFGPDPALGGKWKFIDSLTTASNRAITLTNDTLDLNGKTVTAQAFSTVGSNSKNITFNAGTLVLTGVSTTTFSNAGSTGFTTTAGTGTGKISMTGATAKTFVGGGSTYNCTLSNDGAGALTISGANTFTTIANGVQPTAFVFPISVTQTVTNWNVSGTAGNLVTITSGTAGTAATLSKSSGTVSSNYLSLKDSAATGGAAWYAGTTSTNVSGNSGWIFTAPPGNFFFMF